MSSACLFKSVLGYFLTAQPGIGCPANTDAANATSRRMKSLMVAGHFTKCCGGRSRTKGEAQKEIDNNAR